MLTPITTSLLWLERSIGLLPLSLGVLAILVGTLYAYIGVEIQFPTLNLKAKAVIRWFLWSHWNTLVATLCTIVLFVLAVASILLAVNIKFG